MATRRRLVKDFMTPQPYTVHGRDPIEKARALMRDHEIRHLPVMDDRTVVGILSSRDLDLVLGLEGINSARFVVADVCHYNVYTVRPDAPLDEVAAQMAVRHIGSAIVMEGAQPVGIFTTVDACRALQAILQAA